MSTSQEFQNSLKRDHDSFSIEELGELEKPFTVDSQFMKTYKIRLDDIEQRQPSIPTIPVDTEKRTPSPTRSRRSSTSSLTDAGSSTPSPQKYHPISSSSVLTQGSQYKSAFAAMDGTSAPPPKRTKLTFQEKEQREIERKLKEQQRAEEKANKHAERQLHAEEKARKDAEKELERKKKEAEKEEKRLAQEAEKAAKEERKRKKEEEKRQKEEEKLRAEEEKKKKERSQQTLGSFFDIPSANASNAPTKVRNTMSPAPLNPSLEIAVASPMTSTPSKKPSIYDKLFPLFFVGSNVTMAPINRFGRDEAATAAVEKLIDSYIVGNRSPGTQRVFNAVSHLHLSGRDNKSRGKIHMSVREIMAELSGNASKPIDLTSDSQNSQIKRTGDLLKTIPVKFLHFQEDVRPPYRGTFTKRPLNGIPRLARNPMRRDLPETNYDYDSEAEWVEDEDGEDLKSDGEEEDDGGDEADDMDGFLDDSADDTPQSRRMLLQGELEHTSTGLCWEDHHKKSTNVKLMPYRMEIIIGEYLACSVPKVKANSNSDPRMKAIDPLATHYWQSTPLKGMEPPGIPLANVKNNASSMNGSKLIKPFFTPASDFIKSEDQKNNHILSTQQARRRRPEDKQKKLLLEEDMQTFKDAVRGSDLSKIGMIEVLKKKFPGRTAGQVKATLETCAQRVGSKEKDKRWALNDELAGGDAGAS